MTPIIRPLAAGILAAALASPLGAMAQESMAYETMLNRLKVRQAVTESVIDAYENSEVLEDTSPGDPYQGVMTSGQPLPEDVELQPVPEALQDDLPAIEGAEWARVGNNLVAVSDGVAAVIVWEVLP